MTVLALALALALELLLPEPQRFRATEWYEAMLIWIRGRLSGSDYWDGWPGLLAVALPGPILVGMVTDVLDADGLIGSTVHLVAATAVLFWSLGMRELKDGAEGFVAAFDEGREGDARRYTRELMDAEPAIQPERWPHGVAQALLAQINDRLFAVLFWFLVFGPLGAALYRTSLLLAQRATRATGVVSNRFDAAAVQLHRGLGWIPARLVVATYALVGSFEQTLEGWRSYDIRCIGRFRDDNAALGVCAGLGAAGYAPDSLTPVPEPEGSTHQPRAVMALLRRAVVLWLIAVALGTIAGWFV
jgi:membrane protein required for beta-lactamase induction